MKKRTLWTIAVAILVVVAATVSFSVFNGLHDTRTGKPHETTIADDRSQRAAAGNADSDRLPAWQKALAGSGVAFHNVPNKPNLSICYVVLLQEARGHKFARPTLLIKNTGPSCRLADITLQGSKDGREINYHISRFAYCSPGQWGPFTTAENEVVIEANSYTMILSGSSLPESVGDLQGTIDAAYLSASSPIDVSSPSLQITVDSDSVTINDVKWFMVSGHRIGLVPMFWAAGIAPIPERDA